MSIFETIEEEMRAGVVKFVNSGRSILDGRFQSTICIRKGDFYGGYGDTIAESLRQAYENYQKRKPYRSDPVVEELKTQDDETDLCDLLG